MSKFDRFGGFARHTLASMGFASALVLVGCAENPPGSYSTAEFRADPSGVQQDLFFRPGSGQLAAGEAQRLSRRLQSLVLGPEDDILVHLNSTGSRVIDLQRQASIRSAVGRSPGRLRIVARPGFPLAARDRRDVALVEILSYNTVRVICPNQGKDFNDDQYNRRELTMGCTNAINLANMTAFPRDLTAPDRLTGSEVTATVAAVDRYRAGKVKNPKPVVVIGTAGSN